MSTMCGKSWVIQTGDMKFIVPVILLLVATGFAAGLFLIPLNAALQDESDSTKLGKTIAVQNLCDNIGMLCAGGIVLGCTKLGLSAGQVFAVLALAVAAVVTWLKIPEKSTGEA